MLLLHRAGTIRSAADTIRIRFGPCRCDTYSIHYHTITHVHDLRFQNQEFWISITKWRFWSKFGLIYTVKSTNTRIIFVFYATATIICIGTAWWPYRYLSADFCIDSVPIVTVSPSPTTACLSCWLCGWILRSMTVLKS